MSQNTARKWKLPAPKKSAKVSAGNILCKNLTRLLTDESSARFVQLSGGRVTPGVFREYKASGQEAMKSR